MAASRNGRGQPINYPVPVSLRCLIVDDNPGFLEAARALLQQEGIQVVGVASTGAEAIQRATELRPDVTLLDIDLGEESGFDVARKLVDSPSAHPGRLIIVSAYAEEEFFELIEASPAIGFVRKPSLSADAIGTLLQAASDVEDRRNGTASP
jgi:CheY-like chemotaxis protein